MASNDSKQKRARQNRAQREAREARAKAAAIPAEERKAKYASGTPAEPSSKKERATERAKRERPVRPGDVPVDLDTLEGNWFSKRMQVPGGRQMIFGAAMTIIVTGLTVSGKYPDPDATGKDKKDLVFTFSERFGTIGYVTAAVVLIAALAAVWFTLSPNRRRIWIGCSIAAALCAGVLGFTYFFTVGFLVYGIMRSNKVEGPAPGSRAARTIAAREEAAAAAGNGDGSVDDDPNGGK